MIIFKTYEEFEEFQNEAEGMWEVARDDEDHARVQQMHDLIECIEKQLDPRRDYPWSPTIPENLQEIAKDVSENLADHREE